jgi:DNA polymerase
MGENKRKRWERYFQCWQDCERCGLHETRTQVVFGRGQTRKNERVLVLFLGEAPGFTEDADGAAFVGEAGRLLNSMIKDTELDFTYWVDNAVACRPTNQHGRNRPPSDVEVQACRPRVEELLTLLNPVGVALVGSVARGWYRNRLTNRPHVELVHPGYILRLEGEPRLASIQDWVKCLKGFVNGIKDQG